MTGLNRRHFLKNGAAFAGMLGAPSLFITVARAKDKPYQTMATAIPPFTPIKVLDTSAMPWSPPFNELGWKAKTLYNNEETGDHLVILWVPIGAPGGRNHYHDFHEWAYWLTGDFVNNEYTSPLQRIGDFQQFREGVFLDRPAYSLHGGEPGRLDSQVGVTGTEGGTGQADEGLLLRKSAHGHLRPGGRGCQRNRVCLDAGNLRQGHVDSQCAH